MYCVKTMGFNTDANLDDRRAHDRILLQVQAKAMDVQSKHSEGVIIHDISDIGVSFFASETFAPKSQQVIVTFTDNVDEKEFNVKLDCLVTRVNKNTGNNFYGCKIVGENKDYLLYVFMKHLMNKNRFRMLENADETETADEAVDDENTPEEEKSEE